MMRPKLYLAGGFYGTWRDKIRTMYEHRFVFLDPLEPELDSEGKRKQLPFEEFTAWDLWAIKTSDIVFVYSEASNPGTGYIVEAGYAKGLGKTVILVREDNNQHLKDRYLSFIDSIADYKTNNFEKGVEVLGRFTY